MMKDGEDSGLVAAAGVGEVGGAHWFAQPAQATGLSGGQGRGSSVEWNVEACTCLKRINPLFSSHY